MGENLSRVLLGQFSKGLTAILVLATLVPCALQDAEAVFSVIILLKRLQAIVFFFTLNDAVVDTMVSLPQFVVGIIGNMTCIGVFLSPVPTFIKIYRLKSTKEFSALPYGATLLNCLLWLFYGSPFIKMGVLVMSNNVVGAVIEIGYLCMYLAYAKDGRQLRNTLVMLAGAVVFIVIVVLTSMLAFREPRRREVVVGVLCVVVGTSMYISPLTVMKRVIRTKSTEFMPLPLSVFSLLNAVTWTVYARIGHDLFITIPNALGVIFASCQLVLYAYASYCGHSNPKPNDRLEEKTAEEKTTEDSEGCLEEKGETEDSKGCLEEKTTEHSKGCLEKKSTEGQINMAEVHHEKTTRAKVIGSRLQYRSKLGYV